MRRRWKLYLESYARSACAALSMKFFTSNCVVSVKAVLELTHKFNLELVDVRIRILTCIYGDSANQPLRLILHRPFAAVWRSWLELWILALEAD